MQDSDLDERRAPVTQPALDPSIAQAFPGVFSLLVLDLDPNLQVIGASALGFDGTPAPADSEAGAPLLGSMPVEDAEILRPLLEQALAGVPGTARLEGRGWPVGRALRISAFPRQGAAGIVVVVQDVTIQRMGLSRLKILEDRVRAILDHAPDAIVMIDPQGRIEAVNPATTILSGWGEADLLGRPIESLMAEPYRTAHQGHIDRYLTEGRSGILNVGPRPLPLLRRDGSVVPIELSVGEAQIAGQRRFIGICRDISQRLEREAALAAANAALQEKVEQLETLRAELERQTSSLQVLAAEAETAQKVAEAANEAKSRFVATMSHELRTPLNGILAVAEALSRRDLPSDSGDLVSVIRSSGEGLLSILNEVLDLAKIEAGGLNLDPRPFSPEAVCRSVVEVWRFAAEAKGLELRLCLETLPPMAIGDPDRLRQVLSNLLNNAIKFTERGEVILTAEARAGDLLRIGVADSGKGIPEADRERLFDPFVQADSGVSRRHGGTGLGLTICRELVQLMKGRIWVEAAPSGGTSMIVEVPYTPCDADHEVKADAAAQAPGMLLGDPLILVAEDHPLNRKVAALVLGEAGLRCEFVEDGVAAVEAARTGRFDLILMDVHMPRLDGLAATRLIRSWENDAGRTPIIAVTANAAPDEIAACREAGMDAVVGKPISAAALLSAISDQVDC